ncbi:hypothetical protein FLAN108750_00215 [Flavobacterium antarcticum]|uniref:hypothetical protein n=1 Tax=Flavobacterium antarcticum TaxID=271155 RepID=UPI0004059EFF|nr:hypothetical protein [Flavobacterium antarcticum]
MKNALIYLSFLAVTHFATAQKNYYTFSINKKIGITDAAGIEVLKPTFKYADLIPKKNEIYLKNYSVDTADVIFNTLTGEQKEYESIYDNAIKIKGIPYAKIRTKTKNYLVSQESNLQIPITRKYSKFSNCGRYILERYSETKYAKEKPAPPVKKTTSGVPPPPPPPRMVPPPTEVSYFGIINNDESFKTIKRVAASSYLPLYKAVEEDSDADGNRIVHLQVIDLNTDTDADFDYIIFSEKNTHHLYDGKLKLIKTFTLSKADESALMAFAKKTLNVNLSRFSKNNYPPPPMMAPSSGSGKTKDVIVLYPFFQFKKLENGTTVFELQKTKDESQSIFSFEGDRSTTLDTKKHRIGIEDTNGKWHYFSFDPTTGAVFLPQKYYNVVGITIL